MSRIKNNVDKNNKLNKELTYLYDNGYSTTELTKYSGIQSGATYNRIKKVRGEMRSRNTKNKVKKTHPNDFPKDILENVIDKGLYDYFITIYNKSPKELINKEDIKILSNKEELVSDEQKGIEKNKEDYTDEDLSNASELYTLSESLLENYYDHTNLEKYYLNSHISLKVTDIKTGDLIKINEDNYKDKQVTLKNIILSNRKDVRLERDIEFENKLSREEFEYLKKYLKKSEEWVGNNFKAVKLITFLKIRGNVLKIKLMVYNKQFNV